MSPRQQTDSEKPRSITGARRIAQTKISATSTGRRMAAPPLAHGFAMYHGLHSRQISASLCRSCGNRCRTMSLLRSDAFLSPLEIEAAVTRALEEDLGRAGDITSTATVPEDTARPRRAQRPQAGVIAGLPLVDAAFRRLSPDIEIAAHARDGAAIAAGAKLMTIAGNARAILGAERVALNFLGHLSGIATATADFVRAHRPHQGARHLHAQDHARAAGAGEIRGALRRRLQSPLRPRRRDADQGQPHRGRRRHRGGAQARQSSRRPSGQDRDRSRFARSACAKCSTSGSPTWC